MKTRFNPAARLRPPAPTLVAVFLCLAALGLAAAGARAQQSPPPVQRLTVPQEQITLAVGQSKPIIVKVIPPAAAGQALRYESGNSGFFTVDDKGTVRGVHEGASELAIIAPNGVRATVRVQITPAGAALPAAAPATGASGRTAVVEDIVLGNAGGPIEVGRLERIVAHVLPYDAIGANPFTITSSDPSVLAAIDEAKVVRAVKAGTATLTAATLDGKHRVSVSYTVIPAHVETHPADQTYTIEPQRFGLRYDEASEAAAKANSAGLEAALRYTAEHGFTRLLLEPKKLLYIEPKDTIHLVSNVQLDLNGSEIRLRPNDYPRYVAFLFAEKDHAKILENASIVNGTLTGERDEKEKFMPGWMKNPQTEGGCTIVFEEGTNNGIRNLTVRKSIGFNISSGLGSKSHGVVNFTQNPVSTRNMEAGGFDAQGRPAEAEGLIRTKKPLDVSRLQTPGYTLGYPMGYMGYPYMNSRIYDAWFFDKDMNLLSAERGRIRYRQYALPKGAAYLHLAFYQDQVPAKGNGDFGDAFAFVENRAMPMHNYIIGCTIEDNYSCGFAACGGQGWLIQDNTFRRNGGRMPGCDIDWEDGWEYMQNDLVEGNTFESRVNVIVCAGIGSVFRNNTFRGTTVFWGRSQDYSLLNNVFEKTEGDKANAVKLTLSSQSDIYCVGNRYKNATVGYTRQHAKAPFIGTYEASFIHETFDNTILTPGHIGRLIDCTIRNGKDHSPISAATLENCTIEAGSYSAGGTIRQSTLTDAAFRVLPGSLLRIEDSKLNNPSFSASAACKGVQIEDCRITIDAKQPLVVPNHLAAFTLAHSSVTIDTSAADWALVGGWNATGADTTVTLDHVRFTLPAGFQGYLHKFAWYPSDTDARKITYHITQTDLSKFRRTDEKGQRSNVAFNTAGR